MVIAEIYEFAKEEAPPLYEALVDLAPRSIRLTLEGEVR